MIKVLRNPNPLPTPKTPQCQCDRRTSYSNDTTSTDRQCKLSSSFNINGRNMCTKHAGVWALYNLIDQQTAKCDIK